MILQNDPYLMDIYPCTGCKLPILDSVKLKVEPDLYWHRKCLRCSECNILLENQKTCFLKFNRIFCFEHYKRLFCKLCSICFQQLNKNDSILILSQNFFCHTQCLACTYCRRPLTVGSKYQLKNHYVICTDPDCLDNILNFNEINNDLSSSQTYKIKTNYETDDESNKSFYCNESKSFSKRNSKKPPRIRTVLTEKQLSILNKYYEMNRKPDALTKEQIVDITGLKPRVIRVWFQNKRCKDRKQENIELNENNLSEEIISAQLLKASSPCVNDISNYNLLEIEQFQNMQFLDTVYFKKHFNDNDWSNYRKDEYVNFTTQKDNAQ